MTPEIAPYRTRDFYEWDIPRLLAVRARIETAEIMKAQRQSEEKSDE